MPDPHSPLPLWLRIPLGANAGLGLRCCLCNGDERGDSGLQDDNGVKLNLVFLLSLQTPQCPQRPALLRAAPARAGCWPRCPAARRLLTSAGKRSRGNEALCPPAASGLEKAPAAAGQACCAQPLPRSPGSEPSLCFKPTMPHTKGKIPHSPQNFSFQRGRHWENLVQSRQQQQQQRGALQP